VSFALILDQVGAYYGAKLAEHGATPGGVDWSSRESQRLRFEQLLSVCDTSARFSLNDFGCGYGALLGLLRERSIDVDYRGYDLAPEMITKARELYPDATFVGREGALDIADYTVASGIFNVRLATAPDEWRDYIVHTIDELAGLSRRGFAFNMLTSYSDHDRMRADLYYGDPCWFFDLMKRKYSRWVALLHDYGLYEFTIRVRTDSR
jgi:SAM-dependent methyltransferase